MPSLIVAGAGSFAQGLALLAHRRWGRAVSAFAVDPEFLDQASIDGVPVRSIDAALDSEDPAETAWLVGVVDYRHRMAGRARVVERILAKGHSIQGFVDPRAAIDSDDIDSTATLLSAAVVGPGASIGRATILCHGAVVSHHSSVANCCYLAPGARIAGLCRIGDHTFVGVGATVRDRVVIGQRCIIGAGAVVLADVPDDTVVVDRHERCDSRNMPASDVRSRRD